MAGKLYVQRLAENISPLFTLEESPYDTEGVLQQPFEKHSDLLAGDQIDGEEPRRWLLVSRELTILGEDSSAGRVDHLFIDQEAIPHSSK